MREPIAPTYHEVGATDCEWRFMASEVRPKLPYRLSVRCLKLVCEARAFRVPGGVGFKKANAALNPGAR